MKKVGLSLWTTFIWLCVSMSALAQDSTLVYPDDINRSTVDSFYLVRTIDLAKTDKPELYFEIFRWYKTCYRYGGGTGKGIDCSHFVNMLYEKIYRKKLNNSSASIYPQCTPIKDGLDNAVEGDLLFFKIKRGRISHIAIYLQHGKFAHASTQSGVIISDINEHYYKKHFYRAGRVN
ncbi:MAG: C40 family peptidase [Chitinophagales bacterium]